jgi:hypothetical protein
MQHWEDRCPRCHGRCVGNVATNNVAGTRFAVSFPSRCKTKDKCEEEIIRELGIEPVRDADGSIIR